ncbi:TetR family transcriptional regulator [Saccharopolyspora taberi]|uniref:TetR family transcriptional regulator n=1 Tax=Saccharopolyspora taberi TaxID=60895 RepID=UPI003CD05831
MPDRRPARHGGVAKGAMYFHFPSKEALAKAVIDEQTAVAAPPRSNSRLQDAIDLCPATGCSPARRTTSTTPVVRATRPGGGPRAGSRRSRVEKTVPGTGGDLDAGSKDEPDNAVAGRR